MDSLKNLFSKKKFKGSGHRLGDADSEAQAAEQQRQAYHAQQQPAQPPARRAPPAQQGHHAAAAQARADAATSAAQVKRRPAPPPPAQPQGPVAFSGTGHTLGGSNPSPPARPAPALAPATDFDPFKAVVGGGTACGMIESSSSQAYPATPQPSLATPQPSIAASQPDSVANHLAAVDISRAASARLPPEAEEQLQHCVATIVSAGDPAHVTIIAKLLRNIVSKPQEEKYRTLKLSNTKIKAALVDTAGGMDLLHACSFELHDTGDGALPNAWLPPTAPLPHIARALALLAPEPLPAEPRVSGLATSASATPASATPTPSQELGLPPGTTFAGDSRPPADRARAVPMASTPPADRGTQMLLPANTSTAVPDWVFSFTPAELKEKFRAEVSRRERDQTLMTRAYREKLANKGKKAYTSATVRVRLPEGVMLQGNFNGGELCTAVYEWVTAALADPGAMYELILPDRQKLPLDGTIASGGLMPSTLINLRMLQPMPEHVPSLRQELVRAATIAEPGAM